MSHSTRRPRSFLWLWLLLAAVGVMIVACGGGGLLLLVTLNRAKDWEVQRVIDEAESERQPVIRK